MPREGKARTLAAIHFYRGRSGRLALSKLSPAAVAAHVDFQRKQSISEESMRTATKHHRQIIVAILDIKSRIFFKYLALLIAKIAEITHMRQLRRHPQKCLPGDHQSPRTGPVYGTGHTSADKALV